jgi:ribosomal protein S6--L-glutamate ligase
MQKTIIGRLEYISLPDLNIPLTIAKIDTGAYSAVITAHDLKVTETKDGQFASFYFYPLSEQKSLKIKVKEKLIGWFMVKSSNGSKEYRPRIRTKMLIGKKTINVDFTLSQRPDLSQSIIIGRKFLKNWSVVDVSQEFLTREINKKEIKQKYYPKTSRPSLKSSPKIAILCNNPQLYSNKRILEEAKKLNLQADFVKIQDCYILIKDNEKQLFYKDKNILDKYQAVIPRIASGYTHFGTIVLNNFYNSNIYCLNNPGPIIISRDKFQTFQVLSQKGINLPTTGLAYNSTLFNDILSKVGEPPVIIKLLNSTQGEGVVLSESLSSARSTLSVLKNIKADFLVQEFIKESKGQDIRVFVVGDKIVGAMERVSQDKDEFRSNIHRGGIGKIIELTEEEQEMALRAARLVGLDIAGVDLMRSNKGTLLIEINSSPGLEGIEKTTGINIAKAMIEFLIKKSGIGE